MKLKENSNEYSDNQNILKSIIITGPTASGKTSVSLDAAKALNGEILACDSMQVYRHMDIGTAKATMQEQKIIPHHLIDLIEPWDEFSVADYCNIAKKNAYHLSDEQKTPIFVGGTGLYVTSLVEGYSYESEYRLDHNLSQELSKLASNQNGIEKLYEFLSQKDPEAAEKIHIHNTKRLIRAVELYKLTGKTQKERNIESKRDGSFIKAYVYAIEIERPLLYERINSRVDQMIKEGLIDEVEYLMNLCNLQNKPLSRTAAQAIGYKETIEYIEGKIDKENMVEAIKGATRKYAKRQMTWLRKWPWVRWIRSDNPQEIYTAIMLHLSENTDYFT